MTTKSTSPPLSKLGKVFAVLKLKPIDRKSNSKISTALSHSLSMLAIGSPHIADVFQSLEMTAAGPSRDDSCSHQVQEGVRTVLTIAEPVVGGVPLAGPPLKAVIGGLLEIFNIADVSFNWPKLVEPANNK